jgi:hypothetical protein
MLILNLFPFALGYRYESAAVEGGSSSKSSASSTRLLVRSK